MQRGEEGELSRDDLIHLEGVVTRMLGGGTMEIECDKDIKVTAVLSGRMKKHKIKVIVYRPWPDYLPAEINFHTLWKRILSLSRKHLSLPDV
jgi:hypothetical protein